MIFYSVCGLLLACGVSAFVLVCCCQAAPAIEDGIQKRARLIEEGRAGFRQAIESWQELCKLEGYELWEWEAEELSPVILHDPPEHYSDAIERIMDKWRPCRDQPTTCKGE